MHVQIAAVLFKRGTVAIGVSQNSPHFRAAQEMAAKLAAAVNVCATRALFDGLLDGCRCSRLENLADDARRSGSDAADARKTSVWLNHIRQRHVQRQDRGGRPLVAEHLLLR